MERWYQAAQQRFSVRTYTGGLSQDEMESLQAFADGIEQNEVRIAVGRSNSIFAGKFLAEKISGTDCFAAIVTTNGKSMNAGYVGELFVLECVARGYSTCWLGASFRMKDAREAIELDDGEEIVCVTPLGYSNEPKKQRPRRSVTSLTGLQVKQFLTLPEWQQEAVKCARMAPSALNTQPWDFDIIDSKSITVVRISKNWGYGLIDNGIAMLHIELGAAHCGVAGKWQFADFEMTFAAKNAPDTPYETPQTTSEGS